MNNDPVIFTSTVSPHSPALLRYPEDADPNLLVSQFNPGFFEYDEHRGCPTFPAGEVSAVVEALFRDFGYVQLKSGKSEGELEYENRVKRPAHVRARATSSP
ncbi:hypothetical protein [Streptomyces sp. NRRL S-237]|uniref:hypothetical protein n=1 Tax=Streptomyces sp. NRRL S-237 TaxID=1463895 RepID=UPI00131C80CA|nr:hypothetical protein [Streptomyces sp. NRRL S-237]